MIYYEGIDYWVRRVEFPNMASESVVVSHGDGTFTIYINTLFCEERQAERLEHELRHLEEEHFYRDDLSIRQIERHADGKALEKENRAAVSRILPGSKQYSIFHSNSLPEDVTFGFYVPDNSLRPAMKKGQLVYFDDKQLSPGDIGMFLYHGETLCRQYHKDIFGMTYLFTIDRKQSREDIALRACEEKDLICLGRARFSKRIPLPSL